MILIWYLVIYGSGYNSNTYMFSPPLKDLKTCEFVRTELEKMGRAVISMKCIGVPPTSIGLQHER